MKMVRRKVARHFAMGVPYTYRLVLACGHERQIKVYAHKIPRTSYCVKCSEGKNAASEGASNVKA